MPNEPECEGWERQAGGGLQDSRGDGLRDRLIGCECRRPEKERSGHGIAMEMKVSG